MSYSGGYSGGYSDDYPRKHSSSPDGGYSSHPSSHDEDHSYAYSGDPFGESSSKYSGPHGSESQHSGGGHDQYSGSYSGQYEFHRMSHKELRGYSKRREELYPDSHMDEHPTPEAKDAYKTYKEYTDAANESKSRYWDEYTRETGSKHTKIETLNVYQHRNLVSPAAEVANDTHRNAQGRIDFIEEHPYGYHDKGQRIEHEKRIGGAAREARRYRDRYNTHYSGSIREESSHRSRSRSRERYD